MTTVVFVHGTGVRSPHSEALAAKIEEKLHERDGSLQMVSCLWGDAVGAELLADGASIPTYDTARDIESGVLAEDEEVALWSELYADPYYELRLLGLRQARAADFELGRETPEEQLNVRTQSLRASDELGAALQSAGAEGLFEEARKEVTSSAPFKSAIRVAEEPLDEWGDAIARAIVARVIQMSHERSLLASIATDANARDKIVELIGAELSDTTRALQVGKWLTAPLRGVSTRLGTWYATRKRGALTDAALPAAADILLYQTRGDAIRDFIRARLAEATPPVLLLGHSLGGIASVDLLAEGSNEHGVEQLVTVGSQSPFFYEINALASLPYGTPLPNDFPPWLNIYDLRDFLSYTAAGVFPGRVTDVMVDNRQPFPTSHSAYWDRTETWDLIMERLP